MFKRRSGHLVDLIVVGVYGGIVYAATLMHLNRNEHETWSALLAGAMIASLIALAFNYKRLLQISAAPISSIAAAAQGYIELYGEASSQTPLKTPFQGIHCVWFRSWVFSDQNGDNKPPMLLEYAESDHLFQLRDSSGACMVNPKGAEIIYFEKRTVYKNAHRYVEEFLPAGKRLYVLGHLDTLHHYNSADAIDRDIGNLLASWKANPIKLLNRFDQNRDGKIDMQEWEKAREEARNEVEIHHQMRAHNEIYTLAKPDKGQLYLISALSPEALRSQYQYWGMLHLGVLTLLLVAYFKLA
ncbi:MAG: EF-hand domain-containing protein [Pseudomonadota bacterium]